MAVIREQRARTVAGMSPGWCIEDWLHSIKARIGIVQYLSDKALEAMKEFFQALWPEKAVLETVRDLAAMLSRA